MMIRPRNRTWATSSSCRQSCARHVDFTGRLRLPRCSALPSPQPRCAGSGMLGWAPRGPRVCGLSAGTGGAAPDRSGLRVGPSSSHAPVCGAATPPSRSHPQRSPRLELCSAGGGRNQDARDAVVSFLSCLPGKVFYAPSLETFKVRLDGHPDLVEDVPAHGRGVE